jgi:peptidyl-tRNA hydrolase, PTH1 family
MILIIGLGNPGKKYSLTRHNAGFMLVDKLRHDWNFPELTFDKKFDAEMTEGVYPSIIPSTVEGSNKKIILIKPAAFMNNSGKVVKKILDFYKLSPDDIIIIHDDLDIELGKYKIAADSSSAGHQGVQNIIDELGTQKFKRIRIGIEGEEKRKGRLMPSDEFVLQKFSEEEMEIINKTAEILTSEISKLL